jgi:outer membrane protein assembly factor BamB
LNWAWILSTIAVLAQSGAAHAAPLYSVNVETDELVAVDIWSGTVSTVGSIGHNIVEADLAYHDGLIYVLNNDFGTMTELLALNPDTGAALFAVPVRCDGQIITNAEGLTSAAGQLLASFDSLDAAGSPLFSNALGDLLPANGFLTNVFDYSVFDPDADMDGLTARESDGQIFSLDVAAPAGTYLYEVGREPPSYTLVGSIPVVDDLEFRGDRLFGMAYGAFLYELDPSSGAVLDTIPLELDNQLRGLSVPEPATLGLLAFGGLVLWHRRNSRPSR